VQRAREQPERALRLAGATPSRAFTQATAAAFGVLTSVGVVGTLYQRGWGRVPFSVPSWPWYHSLPFYLFFDPQLAPRWAAVAVPVALAAAAGVVLLHRGSLAWPARIAAVAGCELVLALAVAATAGGPVAWRAPLAFPGEYPQGVGLVGSIPAFLRAFPSLVPALPFHAQGHPAGAMVLYDLLDRAWAGPQGAALLTVALGCLGAVAAAGLARDELGEAGGRLALALWALSPAVVLYTATSADAVFAVVLAGAALAAHRGLVRRSTGWTVAGGALLWVGSMLTYAAVLLLAFLLVRAVGRLREERGWVTRWAAMTAATVLGLVALLRLTAGYDPLAALGAVHRAYAAAPGSASRPYLLWLAGDPVAFAGMLGVPLAAALAARAATVVRERAWASVDAAVLACLLAASAWGFSRGEVERIWLFLVPLALVPVTRQLLAWRVRLPVVAALLVAQTLAVQALFSTRW